MSNRLSNSALIFSVVAASINIFPILLLSWIFNFLLFVLTFTNKKTLNVNSSLIIFFGFCSFYLIYSFLIGVEIFDPEIYRRELKFFIPLSNCFFLSQLRYDKQTSIVLLNCFYILIFMNVIFLIVALVYYNLKIPLDELYPYSINMWESYDGSWSVLYTGLFSSHTAFGGWIGTTVLLLLSLIVFNKNITTKNTFFLISMILFLLALLFLSKSRAYSLSILFVFGIFFYRDFFKKLIFKNAIVMMILGAVLFGGYSVGKQIQSIDVEDINLDLTGSTAETNVAIRYVLWAIAINDFIQSPLIGVGATRYDDDPLVLLTFPEISDEERLNFESPEFLESFLIKVNVGDFQKHTDQHAHNLFLNVIAETGLLGLIILLIMIKNIFSKLNLYLSICKSSNEYIIIKYTYYSFILLLCASMFGNNFLGLIPAYVTFSIFGYLISSFDGPKSE